MAIEISPRAVSLIEESVPRIQARCLQLEEAMGRYLERCAGGEPESGSAKRVADALCAMLIEQAGGPGETGTRAGVAVRHGELDIGAMHYSCFGDGLRPVLRDLLGASVPPAALSAWVDAYWAIVRRVAGSPMRAQAA